ncbi:uncharacterized protein SOCE26_082260 [Sorangium cellulosum]|uniref:Uncharacterized protein n=1 Tax=Sorangium cellulosum TaxID=56 RepID=A0A2L0F5B2_SORCE|nr:hypothetical protein [Sorangium cellulosum]AUX46717.1 uncharacterized protein SOCE26_082260 [Sorangium cellulosum]
MIARSAHAGRSVRGRSAPIGEAFTVRRAIGVCLGLASLLVLATERA